MVDHVEYINTIHQLRNNIDMHKLDYEQKTYYANPDKPFFGGHQVGRGEPNGQEGQITTA